MESEEDEIKSKQASKRDRTSFRYILSSLYYKYGTISCSGLHFSDRTVRLTEIFGKDPNQVI
jgi:hypothetical protein